MMRKRTVERGFALGVVGSVALVGLLNSTAPGAVHAVEIEQLQSSESSFQDFQSRLPIPVSLRGTHSVELTDPSIDPVRGTVEVEIVNHSPHLLTAWVLTSYGEGGVELSQLTIDGYPSLLARQPGWSAPNADGVLEPQASRRTSAGVNVATQLESGQGLTIELTSVVFGNLETEGRSDVAAAIFETRAEELFQRERWLGLLTTIVSSDPRTSMPDLALARRLLKGEGKRQGLNGFTEAVESAYAEVEREPNRASQVVSALFSYLEAATQVTRESTPRAFQIPQPGGSDEFLYAPTTYQCQAVGASPTVAENSCAEGGTDWTVDEQWNFSCSQPVYNSVGAVNARGYCWHGLWARNCPPLLYGPTQQQDGSNQKWTRTWQDRVVYYSPLWSRCDVSNNGSLSKTCPCEEVPDEEPDIDGPDGGTSNPPGSGSADGSSPVLIDLNRAGFELTDLKGGVRFDLDRDGSAEHVSWTAAEGGDSWLALDRDGNGTIDHGGELFGNFTDQPMTDEPNGYLALGVFDAPSTGGNGDGRIDDEDSVYDRLLLWTDRNQDGSSQPEELAGLDDAGVRWIDLSTVESERLDQHGNRFRYQSRTGLARGVTLSVDVFLLTAP